MLQIDCSSILLKLCKVNEFSKEFPYKTWLINNLYADIYLSPRTTKGQAYRKSQLRAKFPSLVNALDKEQHKRKRKFMTQPISERSMRLFEPTMQEQVDIFLQLISTGAQDQAVVNMTERCQRLSVDVVGKLAFGYPFATQTETTYQYMSKVIDDMSWRISIYMQYPPLHSLELLMLLLNKQEFIKFDKAIRTMIKTRTEQDKDAHFDLYSVLADHIGKGPDDMLPGEVWPEAIFFIMAGGSTTATTMSTAFFYLAYNFECYKKLALEIRSTFTSAADITSARLKKCKYLRAVIDECLRMSPATLTSLWREQDPKDESCEPFIVDGHVIPRGTQVGVSLYSLLHNKDYFPDPFKFEPERWIEPDDRDETGKAAYAARRKCFVPFIVGDRACAGKAMAYLETSLVLARTLWYFDFELAAGEAGELGGGIAGMSGRRGAPNEYQLDDLFVAGHDGPNLVFRPRGDFWKELDNWAYKGWGSVGSHT